MPEGYEIRIRREALKFASAHMTVFPDGSKESLHGHNYQPTVTLRFKDPSFRKMIIFSDVKESMKKLALLWDEKVLLATQNPFFKLIRKNTREIEFLLCKKRYVLPADEVVLLKIENVTCENLARAYFDFLKADLDFIQKKTISGITVLIEESPGQGGSYHSGKDA